MTSRDEHAKMQMILQELVRRTNETLTRMREIEQRIDAMEHKIGSLEESNSVATRTFSKKFIESERLGKDLNDELQNMKNSMDKINRQINNFASKRDVKEIEKMVELFSPIKEEA